MDVAILKTNHATTPSSTRFGAGCGPEIRVILPKNSNLALSPSNRHVMFSECGVSWKCHVMSKVLSSRHAPAAATLSGRRSPTVILGGMPGMLVTPSTHLPKPH